MLRQTLLAVTLVTTSALAQKADPFAEGVRTTEPLAPAEQRAKFKLPPGFEIQLVAAEPDLRKPMNMAFDATGRLWVSESREYPFPAKEGAELRDSIRIFSDFGPDGKARKMEVFADKLNIPIGLYPFRTADGHWKCVAWAIPNIWLLEDTDGDGKADKREVLFGPLGWERDTHGNQASFRRGDDGWIYATHGFNNNSIIKARDGSTITLNSGNVYRFRLDGSRVEQWTSGQVNPFGLCWDDRGNLFSADCHSSPIYQLLRGGVYPSFGKPHDGLGFAPQTIQHSHGSTAICGPMMIRDTSWPADLQGHMLIGNVMTSRLNHDLIEWHGSSSKGKEMPDFLTSEDPWFRPVDLQWGPDGALYIADFYNRIIGHYEVPLTHPGRDRERGRIWRVVYKGKEGKGTAQSGSGNMISEGIISESGDANPQSGDVNVKPGNVNVKSGNANVINGANVGKQWYANVKSGNANIQSGNANIKQLDANPEPGVYNFKQLSVNIQSGDSTSEPENAQFEPETSVGQRIISLSEGDIGAGLSQAPYAPKVHPKASPTLLRFVLGNPSGAHGALESPAPIRPSGELALHLIATTPEPAPNSSGAVSAPDCDPAGRSATSLGAGTAPLLSPSMSVALATSLPKEEQIAALIKELGSPNPTRRSLALNELCDRWPDEARKVIPASVDADPFQRANLLWVINRGGRNMPGNTGIIARRAEHPMVRSQMLRVDAEALASWKPELKNALAKGAPKEEWQKLSGLIFGRLSELQRALEDSDAVVRRIATEALAIYPSEGNFLPLLRLLRTTDKADDHLIYSTRASLREHLRDAEVVKQLKLDAFSREDLQAIMDILPAVPGEHAALLRLDLFTKLDAPAAEVAKHFPSIIKNAPADRLNDIAALAQKKLPDDAAALSAILTALDQRGVPPGDALREWAAALVPRLLAAKAGGWSIRSIASIPSTENPWTLQDRKSADGETARLMSSFPKGEKLTGILASAPFLAPERLRFYLCGHDGTPPGPVGKKNSVRLVDAASGAVLREAAPPRNDVAQRIEWDLADIKGRCVLFEATDGDPGSAYAWLAFGRFKPELPELALGEAASQKATAADIAGRFKLTARHDAILALFNERTADVESRAAAARALISFQDDAAVKGQIATALASADEPDALREKLAVALSGVASQAVANAMPSASTKLQQSFSAALSANREGTVALIVAVESGKASPLVLRDKATVDRLKANAKDDELKRLEALLAKLPPANIEADKLIAARRTAFTKGDAAKGAVVFTTNCAVCHQIGQKGNLVGPQLDGIGGRGLDRILEDLLDPNRNVDRAFRLSIVTLKDGGVASGLLRREEGGQMVLADITGKESSIPQANVAKREESDTSLMPPAFGQTIPPADFNDLLAYLLSQRPTK